MVENRLTDIIAITDKNLADPAYSKLKDAENEIYTQQYISMPIFENKKLIATIQIESLSSLQQRDVVDRSKKTSFIGFSMIDRMALGILTSAINLKLETI